MRAQRATVAEQLELECLRPTPALPTPPTLPFVPHSGTSRQAARSKREPSGKMRARVLEFVRAHGPVTDEEIAGGLGMNPSTARPRRVELERQGLVWSVGMGSTASGRRARVWVAR